MSRRISFSLKTSTAALTRSSVELVNSIASSPFQAILVSVPRKSNRVESSLAAWLRALSTSCRSSLLTTSNDESAIGYVPFLRSWPFVIRAHLRCRLATRTTPADCPSGQWERTVNPSANAYPGSNPGSATEVREMLVAGYAFEYARVVTLCHNSGGQIPMTGNRPELPGSYRGLEIVN